MIDAKLMEILACPACQGDVKLQEDGCKIICLKCKRKYPIKDGIPVLLVSESEQ